MTKLTTTHGVRIRQAVAILRTMKVPTRMQYDVILVAGELDRVLTDGTTTELKWVRRNLRTLRDDPTLRSATETLYVPVALEGVIELIMTP